MGTCVGSRENDRRSKKQLALCQTAALTVQPLFKFQCFAVPYAGQNTLGKVQYTGFLAQEDTALVIASRLSIGI